MKITNDTSDWERALADHIAIRDNYVKLDALAPAVHPWAELHSSLQPMSEPDLLPSPFFPSQGAINVWSHHGRARNARRLMNAEHNKERNEYIAVVVGVALFLLFWVTVGADWLNGVLV